MSPRGPSGPRTPGGPGGPGGPEDAGGPPGGVLWVVATPIGNLGDLSPRAVAVLGAADLVLCEDTRRTRALLSAAGVAGGGRLQSLHAHNEGERAEGVAAAVAGGSQVALVTDAGTPGVSDPGARVVAAVALAGGEVRAVPGPSSVVAALSISGLPTDRFCVEGFLPRTGGARRRRLAALAAEPRTALVLEAANRLAATLADLADACGPRPVAVARELTKVHEEVWRGPLDAAAAHFAATAVRGEVVVVVGGAPPAADADDDEVAAAVAERLADGDSPRTAATTVAAALGVPRRRAYEAAIAHRAGAHRAGGPGRSGAPEGAGPT